MWNFVNKILNGMSDLKKKRADLVSESPQYSWKEKIELGKANKNRLGKSGDIVFRILDPLDEKGRKKNRIAEELGVSA